MTNSQTTLEETGTEARTPTFLAQVERLATAIDDYIIPSLRMETHGEKSWSPANLQEEIPDFALQGCLSKETVAEVVSRYLSETVSVVEAVTGLKPSRFDAVTNPVERNTSFFPHNVDCWRERHYSKKFSLDRKIETIRYKLEDIAQQEAADLNASLGLNGFPKLSLNGIFVHSLAEYRQGLYRRTGVQGEEPVLLYQFCFQALAEAKGWDKLEDKELLKVLDAEGIPVKEFSELTDRKIKLSENDAETALASGTGNSSSQRRSSSILILDSASAENNAVKNQEQWIAYWNNISDGRRFASMADYYQVFKQLTDALQTGSPAEKASAEQSIASLRKDFQENYLLTSTRVIYQPNGLEARLIHGYGAVNPQQTSERVLQVPLYWETPIASVYAAGEGLTYLQALFNTEDSGQAIAERLSTISGYQPQDIRLWTPPLQSEQWLIRSQLSERAVVLCSGSRGFHLVADGRPVDARNRSRGVR